MHNRVLLTRTNSDSKVESYHNIKSVKAAQAIIDRVGKYYIIHSEKLKRFKEGEYHDSYGTIHQLTVR